MHSVTVAIYGAGGTGAITTGEILLRLAARLGLRGILRKTFSPQIRGGESATILRLASTPVSGFDDHVDLLVGLDWHGFQRFAEEIPVDADTLLLTDPQAGPLPDACAAGTPLLLDAAASIEGYDASWLNLVMIGVLGAALDAPLDTIEAAARKRLHKLFDAHGDLPGAMLRAGYALPLAGPLRSVFEGLSPDAARTAACWFASGNQMAALGALDAGVRLVAAYPITPASDLLEQLARHLPAQGGHLIQAEDELAAINMIIGAGFGGAPALTATSGPGLALMAEGMGLAVASETPVVVIDVMRGGPSTGIPTKSEQSDLDIAVHGLHGDAPHVVIACTGIADCHASTAWAVALATQLQTLVIVLSDQFLGHAIEILQPQSADVAQPRLNRATVSGDYRRYEDTDDGVSPMALPGEANRMFTADGLEHRQDAVPSPMASEHQRQLDKRLRKLDRHDFGKRAFDLHGSPAGAPLIICWGSTAAAACEARQRLQAEGIEICVLVLRLLAPLPVARLQPLLDAASQLTVVESNHIGQCRRLLRSALPAYSYDLLATPGPRLPTPTRIITHLRERGILSCR